MNDLKMRQAQESDAEFLYKLRLDPVTKMMFFGPPPSSFQKHQLWLSSRLSNPKFGLYILEENKEPLAYFRVDESGDTSVCVSPEHRGRGLGNVAIDKGIGLHLFFTGFRGPFVALIRDNNPASKKSFEASGFSLTGTRQLNGEIVSEYKFVPKVFALAMTRISSPEMLRNLTERTNAIFHLIGSKEELKTEFLEKTMPEKIFFPHWSYIVPKEIFTRWPCVMFHMTDLPFGRGGSPLQNLIVRNFKETKISSFLCDGGLDTGPILMKADLALTGSAQEILLRASYIIEEMIVSIIRENPSPVPQIGEPTLFKRRTPSESNIDGQSEIEQLYNYIRMLDADGYPKAYLKNENFSFEFSDAKIENGEIEAKVRIKKI